MEEESKKIKKKTLFQDERSILRLSKENEFKSPRLSELLEKKEKLSAYGLK